MTHEKLVYEVGQHEDKLRSLQHQIDEMKVIQEEIKTMNTSLVTLTTEMKHTNALLSEQKEKISAIEAKPGARINQIASAVISATVGGVIATIINIIFGG